MGKLVCLVILVLLSYVSLGNSEDDLPCRARDIGVEGRSIVCVCDANYCDTITREAPAPGTYVAYTSSKAGLRFKKRYGVIKNDSDKPEDSDESEQPDETEQPDESEQPDETEQPDESEKPDETEQPDESEKPDETEQPDESEKPDETEQPDESEKPDETEQPDESEKPDETEQPDESEKPDESEQPDESEEPDKLEENEVDSGSEDEEEELPDSRYEDEEIPEGADVSDSIWNRVSMRVYSNVRHQYIEGFGGSVTDAASLNWRKLSDGAQLQFINTYFGSKGIEYNLIRVPIGGSDFSTHPYTYNEYPWHDPKLSNFSLTEEDLFFKLPMIKLSQRAATDEIKITASTWSPPVWMKTNEKITGFAQLRPEYYQAYADYHIRFMEEYLKAEVKIWAITTTNEPLNGIIPVVDFNSLGWTPAQLGRWVANNLGPTIRNSQFNKTLILAVDDQRYILPVWLLGMEREDPKSIEYIDGIAIHYYGNFFPAAILSRLQQRYPDKILLSTEACEGPMPWDLLQVEIGSWSRARRYTTNIMQDLNHFVVGWIDWNLCLDPNGGPNWAENFVDAPILVYADQDEFIKQPMYYAMGHFSKFIPRGSRRIRVSRRSILSLENVAFLKPDNNYVMVLQNRRSRELNVKIRFTKSTFIEFKMEPESIKTIEINPN